MRGIRSYLKRMLKVLLIISIGDTDYSYLSEKSACLILVAYFMQLASYLLNDHLQESINYSFLRFFMEIIVLFNPPLSLIGYSQENLLMAIAFCFLAIYAMIAFVIVGISIIPREKLKHSLAKNNILRISIFCIYIFFTLWNYIFFIPLLHLFLSLSICSEHTLMKKISHTTCDHNYGFTTIFLIGAFLTMVINMIVNFFFVEIHFMEKNYLKKRFRTFNLCEMILKFMLVLLWIFDINEIIVQLISSGIAIIMLYELYRYFTFKSQLLTKFYAFFLINYLSLSAMSIVRTSSSPLLDIRDRNLLFNFLLLFPILGGISVRIVKHYIKGIKEINGEDISYFGDNFDLYLEDLLYSAKNTQNREDIRHSLIGALKEHQRTCKNSICLFKEDYYKSYIDVGNRIVIHEFVHIIDNFFNVYLQCRFIRQNNSERENLILKYFSFLSVDYGNPIFAYSMVLNNLRVRTSESNANEKFMFKLKSKVILQHIEDLVVIASNLSSSVIKRGAIMSMNELSMNSYNLYRYYITFDNFKQKSISMITETIEKKIEFWEDLMEGYKSMEEFQSSALKLSRNIEALNFFIKTRTSQLTTINIESIILNKMMSIVLTLVTNDLQQAFDIEKKVSENSKQTKELSLTDYDILNCNSVALYVSLLDQGKVVGYVSHNASKFFGYSSVPEFKANGNIHNLMPRRFSILHHDFLLKVLNFGEITFFGFPRDVVCKDKDGYIFNAQAFVQFYFGISNEFTISAVFLKTITPSLMFFTDENGRIDGISRTKHPEIMINLEDLDYIYSNYNIIHLIPGLFDDDNFENLMDDKLGRKLIYTNRPMCMYLPIDYRAFFKASKSLLETASVQKGLTSTMNASSFKSFKDSVGFITNKTVSMLNGESRTNVKMAILNAIKEGFIKKFEITVTMIIFAFKKTTGERVNFFQISVHEIHNVEIESAEVDLFPKSVSASVKSKSIASKNSTSSLGEKSDKNRNESFKLQESVDLNYNQKYFETHETNLQTLPNEMENLMGLKNIQTNSMLKIVENLTNINGSNSSAQSPKSKTPNQIGDQIEKINKGIKDAEKEKKRKNKSKTAFEEYTLSESIQEKDRNQTTSVGSKKSNISSSGFLCVKEIAQNSLYPKVLKQLGIIFGFQILVFFVINVLYLVLINNRLDEFQTTLIQIIKPSILIESHSMALSAGFPIFLSNQSFYSGVNEFDKMMKTQSLNLNKYSGSEISKYYNDLTDSNQLRLFTGNMKYQSFNINSNSEVNEAKIRFYKLLSDTIVKQTTDFKEMEYKFLSENYVNSVLTSFEIIKQNETKGLADKEDVVNFLITLSAIGLALGFIFQIASFPLFAKFLSYSEKILVLISRLTESEAYLELDFLHQCKQSIDSQNEGYLTTDFGKMLFNKRQRVLKGRKLANNSTYLSSRFGTQKLSSKLYFGILILTIMILTIYYSVFLGMTKTIKSSLEGSLELNMKFQHLEKALSTLNLNHYLALVDIFYLDKNETDQMKSLNEESMISLQSFAPKDLITLSSLSPSNLKYIDELLKNDLCLKFKFEACNSLNNEKFSKGLQGYISDQILRSSYFRNILEISNAQKDSFQKYISNDEIIDFQKTRLVYYELYKQIQKDFFNFSAEIISRIYTELLLSYLIGGFLVILCLSFILYKTFQRIKRNFLLLRNLIVIIPYSKLTEDTTVHLLKNLQKI